MPQRNSSTRTVLRAVLWRRARWDEWNEGERTPAPPPAVKQSGRLVASTTLVACFVLGGALSAAAGETVTTLGDDPSATPPTEALAAEDPLATATEEEVASTAEEVAPAQTTLPETAPEEAAPPTQPLAETEVVSDLAPTPVPPPPEPVAPAPEPVAPVPEPVAPPAGEGPPAEAPSAISPSETAEARSKPRRKPKRVTTARSKRRPHAEPVLRARPRPPQLGSQLEPEASVPGVESTIWLHRSMPDPTPPSKRLTRAFAHRLRSIARTSQADWALMLGLLRAEGRTGTSPASAAELRALASRLGTLHGQDRRSVALALAGDSESAERAVALAHYHRAVGLRALVRGLEWAKPRLEARLLRDDRIATYEGGRFDVDSGRVDVRVLVLIAYLADVYGEVTVSSLKSGHRLYSRPGVVSAHIYGLAVDISALGGVPIAGNQGPGGLTEDAVRNIMLLPGELMPRQVISLLGLGGPSFPMNDHGDHIHVGY
jgi:outer membrane biosynthesis protein TonB